MDLERALAKQRFGSDEIWLTESQEQRERMEEQEKGEHCGGWEGGENVCRVINVVACFLLGTTIFFTFVFSNVNPYLTSYLRNVTDSDVDYTDTLWLEQTATISRCATMPFLGMLSARIPTRLYLLLGIVLSASYLFGTYWALKTSLWTVLITYGIIGGLSRAVLYPTVIRIGAQWAVPGNEGIVTGAVVMGFGVGSMAWNPLATWYINPDNLDPDLDVGGDKYYTQRAVLDKVPMLFLLLGGLYTAIQFICLLVIRNPPPSLITDFVVSCNDSGKSGPVSQETEPLLKETFREAETASQETEPLLKKTFKEIETTSQETEPLLKKTFRETEAASQERKPLPNLGKSQSRSDSENDSSEYSWNQVLKSRVFWTLWFITVFQYFGISFVQPLFKAYGQTFIKDDHYLTVVATVSSTFNAVGRPVSGLLGDRFGPRLVLLAYQCLFAVLLATFKSCEETGEAAFFVWVCGMFLSICGYYTMSTVLVLLVFGTKNFNTNSGLVESSGIVGALLSTLVAPSVKSAFGWNGLFFAGFAGIFAGVILNISLEWCRCGNSIPQDILPRLSIHRDSSKQGFRPKS